jgi:hypothetical protein
MYTDRNYERDHRAQNSFWRLEKAFLHITGDVKAALFLTYLIDKDSWVARTGGDSGYKDLHGDGNANWFYATVEDIEKNTTLGRKENKRLKDLLETKGLIETAHHGMPRRCYYRVNYETIKAVVTKRLNMYVQKERTSTSKRDVHVGPKGTTILRTNNQEQITKNKDQELDGDSEESRIGLTPEKKRSSPKQNPKTAQDEQLGTQEQFFTEKGASVGGGEKKRLEGLKTPNETAVDVLQFFNDLGGRDFSKATSGRGSSNVGWVKQLLKKGYEEGELKLMVLWKVWDMTGEPTEKNLEPITIFKRHGARYIEQSKIASETKEFQNVAKAYREYKAEGQTDKDIGQTMRTAKRGLLAQKKSGAPAKLDRSGPTGKSLERLAKRAN